QWRADRHDDEIVVGEGSEVGCRAEPAHSDTVGDELVKAGLGNRGLAQVDLVDDILPHIDSGDRPTTIGQYRTDHRADVPEAHDRDAGPHAADQQVDLGVAPPERTSCHCGTKPSSARARPVQMSASTPLPPLTA